MPKLEDAIIPLPPPLGDTMVRESLETYRTPRPKPEEVLKQVVNALKTRQFVGALPKLEYLQSLQPTKGAQVTDPDLLILRGCIYAESNHQASAESIFKKTVLIAPTHPWARLNLAESQLSQKKYSDAENTLSILALSRPESEVVRFKLILSLALQKKFPSAEQELQYLEEHASTPAYYFAKAAIAFSRGDAVHGQDLVEQAKRNYSEAQTGYFYNSLVTQNWLPKQP